MRRVRRVSDLESIRASALPLAFTCGGSARAPGLAIRESAEGAPAAVGSAVHEALRPLVEVGEIAWGMLPGIAQRHGASLEEVRMLCSFASKLWPLVSSSFVAALTEIELSAEVAPGVLLTGHADMLGVDSTGTRARIGDWKTGRKDHDYSEQMRGYAALALLEDADLVEATATVLWVRDGEIENYTMNRERLGTWLSELDDRVLEWDGVYRPGRHCPYCPRSHECEASNAMIRRDVAAFTDHDLLARAETSLALMEPAEIVSLLGKADAVRHAADRVRRAIRAHVETTGDVVAPGMRLTIESHDTREIDPGKAWPVLEAAGFVDDDFVACIDLHVSRIEKRVAAKAGRGKGAAAVRALAVELEKAHAVTFNEKRTLKEKRT